MPDTDKRPWARDNCAQWDHFVAQLEPTNVKLLPMWSTYSCDDPAMLPTRGHNLQLFTVMVGSSYKGLMMVQFNGPDGFVPFLEIREAGFKQIIDAIGKWGKTE